jgi:hypothetical protein
MERKGMWVPIEIINNHELDWINKILLSEIISLSKLDKGCIASNESLGELLSLHYGNVSKRISKLRDLGYIKVVLKKKDESTTLRIIVPTDKKYEEDYAETQGGVSVNASRSKRKRKEDYAETQGGVSGNAQTTKRERFTTNTLTNSFNNTITNTVTNTELVQEKMNLPDYFNNLNEIEKNKFIEMEEKRVLIQQKKVEKLKT